MSVKSHDVDIPNAVGRDSRGDRARAAAAELLVVETLCEAAPGTRNRSGSQRSTRSLPQFTE